MIADLENTYKSPEVHRLCNIYTVAMSLDLIQFSENYKNYILSPF